MKSAVLFILGAILISVLLSKLAKYYLAKIENKKLEDILEQERKFEREKKELQEIENLKETPEKFCESKEVKTQKQTKQFKEVLNKQNSSATRKPKDFNDKQNLTQFNHGTYRDEKGRFKSNKKWNKELKTS
jgi:biopolymer transport protein ExbB/TolQ